MRTALPVSLALACALPACGPDAAPVTPRSSAAAPMSRAADAHMVVIPDGQYVAGSTPEERAAAYDAFFASSGSDQAREKGWFDKEEDRHVAQLPAFRLDLMPVTAAAYAEFVADGRAPAPTMDEATWAKQGFAQVWPDEVVRHTWPDDRPRDGRADHPVVLITHAQATAYCAWRGDVIGEPRRLPTAAEMEKAARGAEGFAYPWGNEFEADKLNSQVGGPVDTVPVGSFPDARSPYGVLDLAGNVFQWTSTPWPPGAGADAARFTVRGSAWDDWAGLGRGAAWHGRPRDARHVIVGFRCAADGGA